VFAGDLSNAASQLTLAPAGYFLQAAPNPFTKTAGVRFGLARAGPVTLKLYDVTGKLARTLVAGQRRAGSYSLPITVGALARGVYLLKLETGDCRLTRKLILQ